MRAQPVFQIRAWRRPSERARVAIAAGALAAVASGAAHASHHLDTPTVIADPVADLGDTYAWMSPDGRRLNVAMTIVGHRFSDRLQYVFHVDSGVRLGPARAQTTIVCRFDTAGAATCWAGDAGRTRAVRPAPRALSAGVRRPRR